MTERQIAYQHFLKTPFWKTIRSECVNRDGGKCCRCGRDHQLQAHHKFYRSKWEDTELSDLETLCRHCHKKEHGIEPKRKKLICRKKCHVRKRRKFFKIKIQKNKILPPALIIDPVILKYQGVVKSGTSLTKNQRSELSGLIKTSVKSVRKIIQKLFLDNSRLGGYIDPKNPISIKAERERFKIIMANIEIINGHQNKTIRGYPLPDDPF